jgi:hypothetical protein
MKLSVQAAVEVPRSAEEVFDFATSCEGFPRFIHPLGPIPGIARAEMLGAAAPKPGAQRRIHMTDGSVVDEEVLAYDRPLRHRYRWLEPPAFPFSLIVRRGEGDWHFSRTGGGTRVEWDYHFDLTSPLVWPLAKALMAIFRRWMQQALLRARGVLAPS